MTDFEEVSTENGFTFKRKRKEEFTFKTSKKIKLGQDDPKDNPNFKNANLKYNIEHDKNQELYSNEAKSLKNTIGEKLISIGVIKPHFISKPPISIQNKITTEDDPNKKEIENKNNEKFNKKPEDKLLPNNNNQIVLFKGNLLTRLPSYPERTYIVIIDKESFQKLDPFRRLAKYFNEMNMSEKQFLENEYKDHKEFVGIGIFIIKKYYI